MDKILYGDTWVARLNPKKLGLYTDEVSHAPFATVPVPQRYSGFKRRQRPGKGNVKEYLFRVSKILEDPTVQESIQRSIRDKIGV